MVAISWLLSVQVGNFTTCFCQSTVIILLPASLQRAQFFAVATTSLVEGICPSRTEKRCKLFQRVQNLNRGNKVECGVFIGDLSASCASALLITLLSVEIALVSLSCDVDNIVAICLIICLFRLPTSVSLSNFDLASNSVPVVNFSPIGCFGAIQ